MTHVVTAGAHLHGVERGQSMRHFSRVAPSEPLWLHLSRTATAPCCADEAMAAWCSADMWLLGARTAPRAQVLGAGGVRTSAVYGFFPGQIC